MWTLFITTRRRHRNKRLQYIIIIIMCVVILCSSWRYTYIHYFRGTRPLAADSYTVVVVIIIIIVRVRRRRRRQRHRFVWPRRDLTHAWFQSFPAAGQRGQRDSKLLLLLLPLPPLLLCCCCCYYYAHTEKPLKRAGRVVNSQHTSVTYLIVCRFRIILLCDVPLLSPYQLL